LSRYFFDLWHKSTIKTKQKQILECDETCSRCYGPNNDQCLACLDGTFLLNGKCIDDCPIGYYANTTSNKCQGIFIIIVFSLIKYNYETK